MLRNLIHFVKTRPTIHHINSLIITIYKLTLKQLLREDTYERYLIEITLSYRMSKIVIIYSTPNLHWTFIKDMTCRKEMPFQYRFFFCSINYDENPLIHSQTVIM